MSKVTKNERISTLEKQLSVMQTQISSLIECAHSHTERLIALEPDNPFHGKFYKPERDTAKELAEVDLSSELTGSELCRAMLERGDAGVMCDVDDGKYELIVAHDGKSFIDADGMRCPYVTPINNQGEPLTQAEAGL